MLIHKKEGEKGGREEENKHWKKKNKVRIRIFKREIKSKKLFRKISSNKTEIILCSSASHLSSHERTGGQNVRPLRFSE